MIVLEDEIGDDCEDRADFGLDDGLSPVNYDGYMRQRVPMIRKKMR